MSTGLAMAAFGGHSVFASIQGDYCGVFNVVNSVTVFVCGAIEIGVDMVFGAGIIKDVWPIHT